MLINKLFSLARIFDDYYHNHFGPTRVAFYYTNEIGFLCQLPIIQELIKDKENYKVTIIGINKNEFKNSEYQSLFIPLKKAQFKKFHFVLVTDISFFYLKRNFKLIHIPHGSAFGNNDWSLKSYADNAVDICFLLSKSNLKYNKIKLPTVNKPTYIVGQPKLDRLANNGYDKKTSIKEYNLDNNKKNILIASHWTQHSILATFGDELVDAICTAFPDYNIVQTAHNKIWTNPKYEEYTLNSSLLKSNLKKLRNKHSNFHLIPTGDVHELLNIADLFITDISSVIIEFSILNRPIVFFNNPKEHFEDQKVFTLYKNASSQFTTIESAINNIKASLKDPNSSQKGRLELKDYFLSNVGSSAQVAVEALNRLKKNQ
jgi:hypothetical protein